MWRGTMQWSLAHRSERSEVGLFKKGQEATQPVGGGEQIPDGRLGMAVITCCDISGTSITVGNVEQRVCSFGLVVYLHDPDRDAELVATGTPATAIIVQFQDLGMTNADGVPHEAFLLTLMPEDRDPYQAQAGNPVPASALGLVDPGSQVPVKLGAAPEDIAIGWAAAAG